MSAPWPVYVTEVNGSPIPPQWAYIGLPRFAPSVLRCEPITDEEWDAFDAALRGER